MDIYVVLGISRFKIYCGVDVALIAEKLYCFSGGGRREGEREREREGGKEGEGEEGRERGRGRGREGMEEDGRREGELIYM